MLTDETLEALATVHLHPQTQAGVEVDLTPLLRAVEAAAVADERKHWRTLLSQQHVFRGSCPDAQNWHDRDPEGPACLALGEWRA